MNKKQTIIVDSLVSEGNKFSFDNNKKHSDFNYEYYSEASSELIAWISKVETYINSNYSEDSGPRILMKSVRKTQFTGNYKSGFETELTKIKGAIQSCKDIEPNINNKFNEITSLLKNIYFWTTLAIVCGGSYKLGFDNGNSKLSESTYELNKKIDQLENKNKTLQINKSKYNTQIKQLKQIIDSLQKN